MNFHRFPIYFAALQFSFGQPTQADVQYRQNYGETVAIYALSNDPAECWPATLDGKVVSRKFADDGITLVGIVIEDSSGQREYVNVDPIRKEKLNRVDLGYVMSGLQKMTKVGNAVNGSVMLCGASGGVEFLDSIWLGPER